MDFEQHFGDYQEAKALKDKNAAHHRVRKLIGKIASNFPKDNPEAQAWFTSALNHPDKKWFVAKLLEKVNPVPKALFDDLVFAALLEHDPSFNKFLIAPCVSTFGAAAVKNKVLQFATHPRVIDNDGVNKVLYWVPRVAV